MGQIITAGAGQHHASRYTLQKADTQRLLKAREPPRQRRYGHGDARTGGSKAAELRRCDERVKGPGGGEMHGR
ncbi:hypothetical protein GCM10011329_31350 [Stakelama pacifica]|nr:hypothetical protein GCM10011329_31350 [Stakelama pacifica]